MLHLISSRCYNCFKSVRSFAINKVIKVIALEDEVELVCTPGTIFIQASSTRKHFVVVDSYDLLRDSGQLECIH